MDRFHPHEFLGRGTMKRNGISIPISIRGTIFEYEPIPVDCTIMPEGVETIRSSFFTTDEISDIEGVTDDGGMFWISDIQNPSKSLSGSQIVYHGSAENIVTGYLNNFESTEGDLLISAQVPYTPLFDRNQFFSSKEDGTISYETEKINKAMGFTTEIGRAELIDYYDFLDEKVGSDEAIIRLKKCQIEFHVPNPGFTSTKEILIKLNKILEDQLFIISLISRQRIEWFNAEVYLSPKKPSKSDDLLHAKIYRSTWLGFTDHKYKSSWTDLIIKLEALRSGLLEGMINSYLSSPKKDVIKIAAANIMMTNEHGYFESHVGDAYLALESLVSGLSPESDKEIGYIVDKSLFRKIRSKISKLIDMEELDSITKLSIQSKLGELNRRPFYDKLTYLIKMYELPISKLWPTGVDIDKELQSIISRRNLFIHQGKIDDYNQRLFDYARIKNLVELWIFKLLGCPDEAINDIGMNRIAPISK